MGVTINKKSTTTEPPPGSKHKSALRQRLQKHSMGTLLWACPCMRLSVHPLKILIKGFKIS